MPTKDGMDDGTVARAQQERSEKKSLHPCFSAFKEAHISELQPGSAHHSRGQHVVSSGVEMV